MIKKNTTLLKCEFGQNFLDNLYLLAVLGSGFAVVAAEEELAVEQLDPNHRKDEEEQHVHDQDIEHILQRVDNTVEHGLNKPKSEISDRI